MLSISSEHGGAAMAGSERLNIATRSKDTWVDGLLV